MFSRRNKINRKRSFFAGLLVLLPALFLNMPEVFATEVDVHTAQTVAKHFYLSHSSQFAGGTLKASMADYHFELVQQVLADSMDAYQKKNTARNTPLYYIFNVNADDGFVIVSGSEKIKPILAYAFKGAYKESEQSPAFHAWMENYKSQILFVLENNALPEQGITEEWNCYKYGSQEKGQTQYNPVGPLLTTRWNQGCFYNNFCPVDTTRPCKRAPAGCAAVAMAQILKFWEHPGLCNKIEGYQNAAYGYIESIDASSYDWSIMPEELNESSSWSKVTEVSKLIHHCGASLKMSYGPKVSAACCFYIPGALSEYFSFNQSVQYIERKNYSNRAWENILKVELDMGRPLIFLAKDPKAVHAFVCDGYQNPDYFHFNWGWSGENDGYYYMDAMAVESYHFTQNQRAIIGIEPESQPPDPWDQIIPIGGCGSAHTHTFKGGDMGSWTAGICDWSTPGKEQIYSFIPPESGNYSIKVTSVNGYIDCGWKKSYYGKHGWNCIGEIYKPGKYGAMSWNAGETYYILLDDEDIAPDNFQFHIQLLDPTSSTEISNGNEIEVFPNPVNDLLSIRLNTPGSHQFQITSLNGQQVLSGLFEGYSNQVDLSSFPSGIYFITIWSKDFIRTRKIVKL